MTPNLYLFLNTELSNNDYDEIYPNLIFKLKYTLYDENFETCLSNYEKQLNLDFTPIPKSQYNPYQNSLRMTDQEMYDDLKAFHDKYNIILITENAQLVIQSLRKYFPKTFSCLYHKLIDLDSIKLLFSINNHDYIREHDYKYSDEYTIDEIKYYLNKIK
jgi:hypothetical protein